MKNQNTLKRAFGVLSGIIVAATALFMVGCGNSNKAAKNVSSDSTAVSVSDGEESPAPVFAVMPYGKDVFVPFGLDNDAITPEASIRKHPDRYTHLLAGNLDVEVTFGSEKNKELKEDQTALNHYMFGHDDKMKGLAYVVKGGEALKKYMSDPEDTQSMDDLPPYLEGLLVTSDFVSTHELMTFQSHSIDGDNRPWSPYVVEQVERMTGFKIQRSHVSSEGNGWKAGIMQTVPADRKGLGLLVLQDGERLYLHADTIAAAENEDLEWSYSDPDLYYGPDVITAIKGKEGFILFCAFYYDASVGYLVYRTDGDALKEQMLCSFIFDY